MDDKKDDKAKLEIGSSNDEKKKNKKGFSGDIFVYIILFVVIGGFLTLLITKIIKNKKYTNEEIENQLVEKAKEYITNNKIVKETYLDNQKLNITLNKNCSELSGVLYLNGAYYPNLMCKEFKSDLSYFNNTNEIIKLKGDPFIVLAEGEIFTDPLYETDYSVRKFGNALPTEGIYNIEYFALDNNISVGSAKRKVIVVTNQSEYEKSPKMTLKGDTSVTTDKGRDYRDNGVDAKDYNNNRIEANIYHNVNTLKDGNYQVVYEAIDEEGRRAYLTRDVIVVNNGYDLTIDITKDPDTKTNKDVTIKLNIKGSSYKHTIMPDGTENTNKMINYKVSENGKYIFRVVDTENHEFTKEVTVDYINKEKPVATCEGTFADNKLTIKVNVTSVNEIDSYRYQVDYNRSEFIKDNPYVYETEKASTASVIVKDIYGNEEEFTCSLPSETQE